MNIKDRIPDFKFKDELYTAEWVFSGSKSYVQVYETKVQMPKRPPMEMMRNFGLPKSQQYFRHDTDPVDLKIWPKPERDAYIAAQWHKRLNGEWWLIKGKPVYITGACWFFLNHWKTEVGKQPDFRREAVEFFYIWNDVERDDNCFGMLNIKPRRIGDTAKSLCALYERATRYIAGNCGLQNITEEDAKKNFARIVEAHYKMSFYFKLQHIGNERPQSILTFKIPTTIRTKKKLKESEKNIMQQMIDAEVAMMSMEHGGSIMFAPSKFRALDGNRLTCYQLDEFGKVSAFDIKRQWGVIKQCLSESGGLKIIGKAIFSSTVEDVNEGELIKVVEQMWKASDGNKLDSRGRTSLGLKRVFRSALLTGVVDKYGDHDIKTAQSNWEKEIQALKDDGLFDDIVDYKRKYPMKIEHALATPAQDCTLLPYRLDTQKKLIEDGRDPDGRVYPYIVKRYSLEWVGGQIGGHVQPIEDPKGKFYISQHPDEPNLFTVERGKKRPSNQYAFSIGCDPIDHGEVQSPGGSKAALAVYRKFDGSVDSYNNNNFLKFNEQGNIINPWMMKTHQFVCSYAHRPDDPNEFFMDAIKLGIYYGAPLFIESQRNSIQNFFNDKGFDNYLQFRTLETQPNKKKATAEKGAPSNKSIIDQYVGLLRAHNDKQIHTLKHLEIIECMRQFNTKNRGERDLSVACGFALLGAEDKRLLAVKKHRENRWDNVTYNLRKRA